VKSERDISIWLALEDAILENGCLHSMFWRARYATYRETGITKNMNAKFETYPALIAMVAVAVPLRAGSASFNNWAYIHSAGPKMTRRLRKAMTCAYMPDGTFNREKNIPSVEYLAKPAIGDLLNDDLQNLFNYSAHG
jgi:phytanoyl-CoA hydroxylase